MKRLLVSAVIALLSFGNMAAYAQQEAEPVPVSVMHPDATTKNIYRNHIDALDPSPQNNPKGADAPGFRAPHQLVIYTPEFGETTQTNGYGMEAIVDNGRIQSFATSNSPIPDGGFVISGHGNAGQWMKRVLKVGATVHLDLDKQEIIVENTPAVYLTEVDQVIDRAEKTANAGDLQYQNYLSQAVQCRNEMDNLSEQGVTQSLVDLSQTCQNYADKAFYRSIPSFPQEFRGVWVRPVEHNAEEVRKALWELKSANIHNIFLETYYQGRTIYPSKVMAEYGLPTQQNQFEGWDPLQAWVDEAHKQGLKVHVWVQTFFAGDKNVGIEDYGPILHKYPQWTNVQRTAVDTDKPYASSIEDGHFFLDPANPEVRTFLDKLLMEVVSGYNIDGLNLDYIRYPESYKVNQPGFLASTWGYTPYARQAFQDMLAQEKKAAEDALKAAEQKKIDEAKKAGKPLKIAVKKPPASAAKAIKPPEPKTDPKDFALTDPLWPRWVDWREAQVSGFVKQVSGEVHAAKPNVLISAVVFPQTDPKFEVKLQNWPQWVNEGWIQALTPIGLTDIYRDSLNFKRLTQDKVPVYVGVFGMYNRATPVELLNQIDAAHRAGMPGIVLFERSRLDKDYREALLEGAFRE